MRIEIENWLKQSEADFNTAKNSLKSKDYYASVFWSQQSIEKAFKALCLLKLKEIPKSHSIIYFAQKLKVPEKLLSGIRDLNPEYLITRYPDMAEGIPSEVYDIKIATRHQGTVKEVLKWVKKQIQK